MKLPDWLHARTTTSNPGAVTIDLTVDVTQFELAMLDAAEQHNKLLYRQRLNHERAQGILHVGRLLDQLCTDLGLDPRTVWREPRAAEQQWAFDVATIRARRGYAALTPEAMFKGIQTW